MKLFSKNERYPHFWSPALAWAAWKRLEKVLQRPPEILIWSLAEPTRWRRREKTHVSPARDILKGIPLAAGDTSPDLNSCQELYCLLPRDHQWEHNSVWVQDRWRWKDILDCLHLWDWDPEGLQGCCRETELKEVWELRVWQLFLFQIWPPAQSVMTCPWLSSPARKF